MSASSDPSQALLSPNPSESVSQPHQSQGKPRRRREKPQLSCTICRQKKLRCDRVKPCLNCTKRGQPESCDYIRQDSSNPGQQGTAHLQDRVLQLEDMVKNLLKSQTNLEQNVPTPSATSSASPRQDDGFTQSAAPSPHDQIDPNIPKSSLGKFAGTNDEVNFVGGEHWEAILEDITNLKIDLETADTSEIDQFKPQILFGINHASRSEILSSIPPKPICDMLISRWFRTMDMAPMVVHVPTFMKEYNLMFEEPDEMPLTWIGLLFSIFGLASYFYAVTGEELHTIPEPFTSMWEMTRLFRVRTAQCLVEVNYLYPKKYTVNTLCFYYALEKFEGKDSEFGSYVILGIIVRVAMRLGYHRDASHYPSISPFDGEMRRRIWCMIFHLDFMASAHVGLPRMIREGETDTAEPKNLLDADIDEDMTELPHPRPSTYVTPVAYAIFMVRLFRQIGRIVDHTNSTTPPLYDEVMRLDLNLRETHDTFPPYLTMRSLSLSITDDADLILRRFALEVCFQKGRCVLHRKYLILGKTDPQFQYSKNASVDAAMKLLDVQCLFYEATQPGGQLFGEQWRTAALINQDYVLAAMILCLDLAWDIRMAKTLYSDYDGDIEALWPINKRLQALRTSYDIWSKSSKTSALAAKATEALRIMLKDLEPGISAEAVPTTAVSNTTTVSDTTSVSDAQSASQLLVYSDQAYLGISDKLDFDAQGYVGLSSTDFPIVTTDTEMNFDWELWDSQFQPLSIVPEDFGSLT